MDIGRFLWARSVHRHIASSWQESPMPHALAPHDPTGTDLRGDAIDVLFFNVQPAPPNHCSASAPRV